MIRASLLVFASFALQGEANEERFQQKVQEAKNVAEKVLGTAKRTFLPADAPHTYDDKYAFVEAQASGSPPLSPLPKPIQKATN